ncbi:hypothetical protein [Sphingomonas adhaesiva]|uniref:hypothetical protein n=1 Tax=Sphingomonas adhaesiva TaxID=28212 RepID=UPI002FF4F418
MTSISFTTEAQRVRAATTIEPIGSRRTAGAAFALPEPAAPTPVRAASSPTVADAQRPSQLEEALKAFEKEARMTPQQRIRRDVLKEHQLTDESLDAMTPAERKQIEDKIAPRDRPPHEDGGGRSTPAGQDGAGRADVTSLSPARRGSG